MVVVPDEQSYAYKSQNEFKGYDKDILHSDDGFISQEMTLLFPEVFSTRNRSKVLI
jgi:hypothetical protein